MGETEAGMAKYLLDRTGMQPGKTKVLVHVTLEVELSKWGANCTIAQAASQATEEAVGAVRKLVGPTRGMTVVSAATARVIHYAEPKP